jgi:DNA polymerase-1
VKDVCYTRIIAGKLANELRKQQLWDFFQSHVMALQPHLTRMMVGGVKVDMSLKEEIAAELSMQVEQARRQINSLAAQATHSETYEVNPNSPMQVRKLLFSELGLVGRGTSVDEENRNRMRSHPRTPEVAKELLNALDNHAEVQKLFSTYAMAQADPDGRIRCEYRQTGTQSAPGRLSSAQTLWGTGMNLQNIPEVMKKMFIADDGYELSYFDAAQIEARFVAFLANIATWKAQFERARLNPGSYDAHRALAADLYDMVYEVVPTSDWDENGQPTVRYIAKRCRHGLNYRMQAPRLATTAKLPVDTANRAFFRYHKLTPEIRKWWDRTIEEAKTKMELRTPLGRRWILLERPSEDTFDSVIAFVPQSTAGDHISSVIRKCERDPRWPKDARMVLNIHDANIAMHRPEDGDTVRGLMKLYAEEAIWFSGEPCIVPADFAISQPDEKGIHRWSTLKKVKTPVVSASPLAA